MKTKKKKIQNGDNTHFINTFEILIDKINIAVFHELDVDIFLRKIEFSLYCYQALTRIEKQFFIFAQ